MRGLPLLALLAVGALVLSGCSSKSDSSTSNSSSGSTSRSGTGTGTRTGTLPTGNTSQAPNLPPVIRLTVSNATGTVTNVTFLKGALTFDATGSHDADSDGLSAIAIVAQDSNKTFEPRVLYDGAHKFSKVTYTFDHAGPVNVTVSAIDVRGDLTTLRTQVFVDQRVTVTSQPIAVVSSGGTPSDPTDCVGPGSSKGVPGGLLLDATSFDREPFAVVKGVQSITATWVSGDGRFAICGPDGKAVSKAGDSKTPAATDGPLVAPKGLETYQIGFTANKPKEAIVVAVVVHYEPKAKA